MYDQPLPYKRQYRSEPRPEAIRGTDYFKVMGMVFGFVLLCWLIVFG